MEETPRARYRVWVCLELLRPLQGDHLPGTVTCSPTLTLSFRGFYRASLCRHG